MITIFTVPKAFTGIYDTIQRNAITSWTFLKPKPEIILCGNDEGVANFAKEKGLLHISDVRVSKKGTPFLDDVFLKSHKQASNDILVYSNCDIILMADFMSAIEKVKTKFSGEFLIVGQRFDADVRQLNFTESSWEIKLKKRVMRIGKYHGLCGIDYFVFRRGSWECFPPFIVGRPCWDMWFVQKALKRKHAVVNATSAVFVIHQNHDYSHIKGGRKEARNGSEARYNAVKVDPNVKGQSIRNANYKIEEL